MQTAGEASLARADPAPGEAPAPWWKCIVAALPGLVLGAIALSGFYVRTVPRRAQRTHMAFRRG
ncbi:MAG TPA: hypothetical protein VGX52_17430 [Burkholderiales bacterium]|nr:hypothetical protein [Burkholderiales bacterium]